MYMYVYVPQITDESAGAKPLSHLCQAFPHGIICACKLMHANACRVKIIHIYRKYVRFLPNVCKCMH